MNAPIDRYRVPVGVERFVIALTCANQHEMPALERSVEIDLAEFHLTPREVRKLRLVLKRLNHELKKSLQDISPVVCVFSEIRPTQAASVNDMQNQVSSKHL